MIPEQIGIQRFINQVMNSAANFGEDYYTQERIFKNHRAEIVLGPTRVNSRLEHSFCPLERSFFGKGCPCFPPRGLPRFYNRVFTAPLLRWHHRLIARGASALLRRPAV